MSMPIDLILVRHGESEGNVAVGMSKRGDEQWITHPVFKEIHSSWWRLTDAGCDQAAAAGAWIREHLDPAGQTRHFVSPFNRAMETAALLGLPDVQWRMDWRLRERERGEEDLLTAAESEQLVISRRARTSAPLWWRPAGGESIADTAARVRDLCDTLHRECADQSVIIVCHGEVIEAFRLVLEHMTPEEHLAWSTSKDPLHKIHNGQVIHYTRRNPDAPEEIRRSLNWRRSIDAPTGQHDTGYEPIERAEYTNADLLAMARLRPRIVE